ncbi:aminoglycoside 3'-phosphotransferase [Cellulomonas sp. H30R-01]|uniref:aminoglycoside 3'-phosphotransferase n=1 Tax=Cellulomonas sp. H30R-01 TaxID=2704467 RepID=UPI00138C772B|nr:aminoglycoside 3'-phosphotransferase [Cellulomonas sp. H30R-01]QHT58343.1 aminoglycoside 3'-phosphotransferase [Cellulomonas sp. H30R-01]
MGGVREVVWRNELGGLTFLLDEPERFVKWVPAGVPLDLDAEVARLRWAAPLTPVPTVLEAGADDEGSWLVTHPLAGRSAVDQRWVAEPLTAVRAIGAGLRALHDTLPVEDCPFDWTVEARVAAADAREVGPSAERAALGPPPPVDRLVVCHGDACAPNTLLADDGTWLAHVDLGALGVADRWADLAVATYSTIWNYGPGYEEPLLDAYGIAPDPVRTAFYRGLWDAT